MNLIAVQSSSGVGRKAAIWLVVPILVTGSLWAAWKFLPMKAPAAAGSSAKTFVVVTQDFPIRLNKDGELQAVNNREIISEVEGSTTIQTIVPEGSNVKKGDVLVTLDSASIVERIEATALELERAEADFTTAVELKEIQDSTNAASLEAAKVSLLLAELDLKQYVEGTYPQMLSNAETDLKMAEIALKNTEDRLSQTRSLFLKNFVTATAVKDEELSVTTARNNLAKAQMALQVLRDFTHEMNLASKQNALSQSKQNLERTIRMNASQMAQRQAEVNARTRSKQLLTERMEKYQQQLAACTITAPADGLVVYASSNERFSNQNAQILEGAVVREQQRLIRLPDTSSMKAVVRINEAQVSRLREGQRARVKVVGVPDYLDATLTKISVLSDSNQRQFNPDIKEYPVDLTLDTTPTGLKPGMGAMSEIFLDYVEDAKTVPLGALYAAGQSTYVFVKEGDQFKPRDIRVGRTNETLAEVVSDQINPGDEVLLLAVGQGQELLDKAGIKVAPTAQAGGEPGARRGGRGRRGGGGGGNGGGGGGVGGAGGGNGMNVETAPEGGENPVGGEPGSGGGRRGGRGRRGGGGGNGGGEGVNVDGLPSASVQSPPPGVN